MASLGEVRLAPEVREVLERAKIDGNRLTLTGTLDRKLYLQVNQALEILGGKWSKRERAHLFEEPAAEVVADAVATGTVLDFRKAFQFYETPEPLARRLVEMADIRPGMTVLEPSAGLGRIALAILDVLDGSLTLCELNEGNRRVLDGLGLTVSCPDFLALSPISRSFDRIVANPPFARAQDVVHVTHMWSLLRPSGRLVSIMSTGWTFRTERRYRDFAELARGVGAEWTSLPEGTFKESGATVGAGIIVMDKPEAAHA